MVTIQDYLNKAIYVRNNLAKETAKIIEAKSREIAALNIHQIEESNGSDGNILKNSNKKYTGLYSPVTQLMSEGSLFPKIAGQPYNFVQTGEFISNFKLSFQQDKASIFSTGTGSGDKKRFFDGYKNLYGLDKDNTRIFNYEILKPELDKFIKKHL